MGFVFTTAVLHLETVGRGRQIPIPMSTVYFVIIATEDEISGTMMCFQNSNFIRLFVTDSLIVVIDMGLILNICICLYNCSIHFEHKILIFIVAKCRCPINVVSWLYNSLVCLRHMSLCLPMCRQCPCNHVCSGSETA